MARTRELPFPISTEAKISPFVLKPHPFDVIVSSTKGVPSFDQFFAKQFQENIDKIDDFSVCSNNSSQNGKFYLMPFDMAALKEQAEKFHSAMNDATALISYSVTNRQIIMKIIKIYVGLI